MLLEISEQSKQGFIAAAEKLGLSTELPNNSFMRPDLALNITADYMLKVIIEAGKDGKVHDITNHKERKYEVWVRADHGYEPGSGGSGFRFCAAACGHTISTVGARLSFNSDVDAEECFEKYPDLWEIVMLNVR